jgi:hypothetical protein
VALRRSIERRTGGRLTKPTAILDLPVVAATKLNVNPRIGPVKRLGQFSSAVGDQLAYASSRLCRLTSGIIDHLGRSGGNSLKFRVPVTPQGAIP